MKKSRARCSGFFLCQKGGRKRMKKYVKRNVNLGISEIPHQVDIILYPDSQMAKIEGKDFWIMFNSERIKDCDGSFAIRQEFGDFFRRRFVVSENKTSRIHLEAKLRFEKWDHFFGELFLQVASEKLERKD